MENLATLDSKELVELARSPLHPECHIDMLRRHLRSLKEGLLAGTFKNRALIGEMEEVIRLIENRVAC